MKVLLPVLLLAATTSAHCEFQKDASLRREPRLTPPIDRFSKLVINGTQEDKEWTSIRMTKNYQDDHGVTDVNSPDIRCFQMRAGTGTASVAAGSTLGFVADQGVTHPGPVQFYMARVPEGANINTWEAAGKVWFKAGEMDGTPGGSSGGTSFNWPAYSIAPLQVHSPQCFAVTDAQPMCRSQGCQLHSPQGGSQR